MTISNDTHEDVYSQILSVQKHMDALKDVYENMPDTDRYFSVLSIIGESMEKELSSLSLLVLKDAI